MEQDVCATIPLDTTFHYLAEGAANVVYRIEVPLHISTPPPSIIEEYEDGEPIPSDDDISPSVENNFESKSHHVCASALFHDLYVEISIVQSTSTLDRWIGVLVLFISALLYL